MMYSERELIVQIPKEPAVSCCDETPSSAVGACGSTLLFWCAVLSLVATIPNLAAHPAQMTSATATFEREGLFHVVVDFDVLAFALNDSPDRIPDELMNALLDGPISELERCLSIARGHFAQHFRLMADSRDLKVAELRFPTVTDVIAWKSENHQPRLPVRLYVDVSGRLPANTTRIALCFPEIIGTIVLTVERPGEEAWCEPVEPGATSTQLAVALFAASPDRTPRNFLMTISRFAVLGFTHVLPKGGDHVLFVLGLFLLGVRLTTILWQVTVFTLAHSVTLGLFLYGVVRLPPTLIEPLIAFSIVLIALDNLRSAELSWWRLPIVFGFGLVHGMGFANALIELGISHGDFPPMLVGFNLGVELGQITVIGFAFGVVGWYRSHSNYRRLVVIPTSIAIGCIAIVWTITRVGTAVTMFSAR